MEDNDLLSIEDLCVSFDVDGVRRRAVDGVTIRVPRGRTVAVVGESGSGKSVTALSVLRLLPQPPAHIEQGRILLRGPDDAKPIDLLPLPDKCLQGIRGNRVAMVFQDALTALNPVLTVGEQIAEAITLHEPVGTRIAQQRTLDLLDRVRLPEPKRQSRAYPHQLSGGMRQRVLIAMALACEPELLIADEPTTALDVTIQTQILALLTHLQEESNLSILLITHDFGVVAAIAHYVYVMYAGRVVEHASVGRILENPIHPYTQGLLACVPRIDMPCAASDARTHSRSRTLPAIPGRAPSISEPISGCRFHPRCALTVDRAGDSGRDSIALDGYVGNRVLRRCVEHVDDEPSQTPPLAEQRPGHFAACWEVE